MHGVGGHLTICLQDHTCADMMAGLLHMCMLVSLCVHAWPVCAVPVLIVYPCPLHPCAHSQPLLPFLLYQCVPVPAPHIFSCLHCMSVPVLCI